MADLPSFSLGLDLDPDPNPTQPPQPTPSPSPNFTRHTIPQNETEHFGLEVADSDPESEPELPRVTLKRLRRGLNVAKEKKKVCENGDDDIEEFSSQDEEGFVEDGHLSTQHKSVCSSSKMPLGGSGVLTSQLDTRRKGKINEHHLDAPASSSLERGQTGLMFPKLTISPLRRFQLIDSDSDSDSANKPSVSGDASRFQKMGSSVEQRSNASERNSNFPSMEKQRNDDLWKDFCPTKSFRVPTPVLDEFCEEYFQSLRNKNVAQNRASASVSIDSHKAVTRDANSEQSWNLTGSRPPAHRYFFHDDPRIQKLVRTRFPNFIPLGTVDTRVNIQSTEPIIDYMGQFNGEASKQKGIQKGNGGKGSTRRGSKSKLSNVKEVSNSSQGWVDPKSTATIPKDAGKRRVHANGQTAGHWYTSPEGRKVYVSRSGQELSGQSAYRHYKKESGGFRKSKKKVTAKRKKG